MGGWKGREAVGACTHAEVVRIEGDGWDGVGGVGGDAGEEAAATRVLVGCEWRDLGFFIPGWERGRLEDG